MLRARALRDEGETSPWCLRGLFVAFVLLGACKRGGGPGAGEAGFPLVPVSRSHDALAATLTWPNVDKSLADVGAVAKKLGLPFSGEDAKSSLLAQLPARAALDRIDWSKPVAVAVVATNEGPADGGVAGGEKPFGVVVALTPRVGGPASARDWAPFFGTAIETRQDAVAVRSQSDGGAGQLPSETVFLLVRDGVLLAADSWPTLGEGGALALAARATESPGPLLSLRPVGMARAQGTTLEAALAQGRSAMRDALARDEKTPPLVRPVIDELAQLIMGWVADTESFELGLGLDDVQGLSFAFKVRPRAGTGFAQLVASGKPYLAEPALASTPEPAFYAAAGGSDFFKAMTAAVRKALAGQTDLKAFDALTDAWSGAGSVVVSDADGTSYDIVYAVEAEKSEPLRAWLDGALGPLSLGDLTHDPSLAGVTLVLEKDGDAFYGHFAEGRAKARKRPDPEAMALMRKVTLRFALEGGRFVGSVGMAKKDHFERLRASVHAEPVAATDGALAPVLAATKGALAVEYVDLAALVRMAFGLAAQSGNAGHRPELRQVAVFSHLVEGLHLPVHAELRGGDALAMTWHLPMETATSAAALGMQIMSGVLQAPPPDVVTPSAPPRRRRP